MEVRATSIARRVLELRVPEARRHPTREQAPFTVAD